MMDRRFPHVLDTSSLLESFLQDDIKKQQQIKLPKRATETKGRIVLWRKSLTRITGHRGWPILMIFSKVLAEGIIYWWLSRLPACFRMEMTWNTFHLWKGHISFINCDYRLQTNYSSLYKVYNTYKKKMINWFWSLLIMIIIINFILLHLSMHSRTPYNTQI